jgi:hypothetical protein
MLGASLLVGVTAFVAWQEGLPAYQRSQDVSPVSVSEALALPAQVYDPPPYARATDEWGPPGPVSLVFRGRSALEGFSGEAASPWYAVSARTGDYHRVVAPYLDDSVEQLWLGPAGTKVAWSRHGAVALYDMMTGETRRHAVPGVDASTPLVWSPGSARLAVGTGPVRLVTVASGTVRTLPLAGGQESSAPAWTVDGEWVGVASADALIAVEVATGAVRRTPAPLGAVQRPQWNAAGDLAGTREIPDPQHTVLRVAHAAVPASTRGGAQVAEENPEGLVIDRFLGWADRDHAVLTGLRPETGRIEQAMVLSLRDDTLQDYMQFPTLGDNWVGTSTVSVATDLLRAPSRDFEQPTLPWSPGAKLLLCLLLAVFPVVYFLIARRPRSG